MSDEHDDTNDNDQTRKIWTDLVRWVQGEEQKGGSIDGNNGRDTQRDSSNGGGYVHPSLTLRGNGPSRGVVATTSIQKGETLIRIPSALVLSGEDDGIVSPSSTTTTTTIAASPWLRCVGAFLRAKQKKNSPIDYEPYLRSLPMFQEYETLQQWSTEDDVKPFLAGTTLGSILMIDRDSKGIETRYRQSVKPFLRQIAVIVGGQDSKEGKKGENASDKTSDAMYQSFLEATMCISTRGFHLLPTTDSDDASKRLAPDTSHNSYGGPFLLPVIDLLNHNPQKACTTLRRYKANEGTGIINNNNNNNCFKMIAERNVDEGEEIFHSYGTDLTSAQLLQTFGFVPRTHSRNSVGDDTSNADARAPTSSTTPVGLRKMDHLIAAARCVKTSPFPESLMLRIKQLQGQTESTEEEEDDEDEDDFFWEVQDIPDRLVAENTKSGNDSTSIVADDEFLISISSNNDDSANCKLFLLTDDIVTLLTAQFLPDDAFLEIFPEGSNTVHLDRSILIEDYYLGMLVCKTLLVAIRLKTNEYCGGDGSSDTTKESTGGIKKAVSGCTATAVGRYLSSTLQQEKSRVEVLLRADENRRELYGRTIRIEEMKQLCALCDEIECLVSNLSLAGVEHNGDDTDEGINEKHPRYRDSQNPLTSPPNKKSKTL